MRPQLAAFPVVLSREARYGDLDPSRRIGRDALVRWFEDARVAVERDALGRHLTDRLRSRMRLMLASVQVDVVAPLRVADSYRIGLGVTRVGRSSFSYAYCVFAGDGPDATCVASGTSTSVHVTEDGPTELPAPFREAFTRLHIDGPEPARPPHDPARLVRHTYPFRVDVRARFGDLDTNRHVNNVALAGWYLDALAELHLDVLGYPTGGPLDSLAPSSLRVDYLAEVQYPAIHQLRVGVAELDDTAVRYACALFDGPRCLGLAEADGTLSPDEDPELPARLASFQLRA